MNRNKRISSSVTMSMKRDAKREKAEGRKEGGLSKRRRQFKRLLSDSLLFLCQPYFSMACSQEVFKRGKEIALSPPFHVRVHTYTTSMLNPSFNRLLLLSCLHPLLVSVKPAIYKFENPAFYIFPACLFFSPLSLFLLPPPPIGGCLGLPSTLLPPSLLLVLSPSLGAPPPPPPLSQRRSQGRSRDFHYRTTLSEEKKKRREPSSLSSLPTLPTHHLPLSLFPHQSVVKQYRQYSSAQ